MTKKRLLQAVGVYLGLLILYAILVLKFCKDQSSAGQFGDMFGCFTAALNGLALFGVAYTISLQNSAHVVATLDIFHRRWNETPMLRTRFRTCQRILEAKDEKFSQSMQHVAEYFEHMGSLVKLQAINSHVIWELYSWYVESYWKMFETGILAARAKHKDETGFSQFEWLYNQMQTISKSQKVPTFAKSKEEVLEFARSDKKLAERLLALQKDEATLHNDD